MKSTFIEFELVDGTVELTLNFARLLKVKNHNKKLYDEFTKILGKRNIDIIFDSLKVIYVCYLCANSDKLDEVLSEEEFMEKTPLNLATLNNTVGELLAPKKK